MFFKHSVPGIEYLGWTPCFIYWISWCTELPSTVDSVQHKCRVNIHHNKCNSLTSVLTLGSQAFKPREYYFHALGVLRRAGVLRLDTLFPGRLIGLLFPFFWCSPSGFSSGFQFLFLIVPCSCICWASSLTVMVCMFFSCFGLLFLFMKSMQCVFSLSLQKSFLFYKLFLTSECSECRAETCFMIYLVQCPWLPVLLQSV